jgi:hypothetical protein
MGEKMSAMKGIKVLIGVLLMLLGLLSYGWWFPQLIVVVKGLLGLGVALVGFVVLLIGISD